MAQMTHSIGVSATGWRISILARLQRTNLAAVTAGWQTGPAVDSMTNRYGTQVTNETRLPIDGRSSYFQTLSVAPQ
jgi:hypothetical protein